MPERRTDSANIRMANPFAQVAWAQQRTLVQAHAAITAWDQAKGQSIKQKGFAERNKYAGRTESVGLLRPGRPIREDVWKLVPATFADTQTHGPVFWLRRRDDCTSENRPASIPPSTAFPPAYFRQWHLVDGRSSFTAARPRRIFTAFPTPSRPKTTRRALQPPEGRRENSGRIWELQKCDS